MSEEEEDKPQTLTGDEVDLDLEWDDALAEWEVEVDVSAEAESPPMPQSSREDARQLYRPPSPDEQFAARPAAVRPRMPDRHIGFEDDDEDEVAASTRIAAIPQELIDSLVERGNDKPTAPPPPKTEGGPPPAVDLDLDGLLEGMEENTASAAGRVDVAAARRATLEPDRSGIFDPFEDANAQDDDDGVIASFPPPRPTGREVTRVPDLPRPPGLPTSSEPAAAPEAEAKEAQPREPEPRQPRAEPPSADPPPKLEPPKAALGPPIPRPRLPRPGSPPIPKPNIPRPSIPRPGGLGPPIPRPNLPKPTIPKPGVPRPGLPRPAIPRPGAAPGVPKPAARPRPTGPGPSSPEESPPSPLRPTAAIGPTSSPEASKGDADRHDRPTPVPEAPAARAKVASGAEAAQPPTGARDEARVDVAATPGAGTPDDVIVDDAIDALLAEATAPSETAESETAESETAESETAESNAPEEPIAEDHALDALLGEPPSTEGDDPSREFDVGEPAATEDIAEDHALDALPGETPSAELGVDEPAATTSLPDAAAEDEDAPAAEGEDAAAEGEDAPALAEGGEDDDDELVVQAEVADDEDWEDEDWEALEAEADAARAEADRGAVTARRSVRSRKPRDEHFPMVGEGAEALDLRRRLLVGLADKSKGPVAARLLVSAAELAEQIGHADEARELYRRALDADPEDVIALRALRRGAILAEAWDELAELLEKEAALPVSAAERSKALTLLAELALARRRDPKQAADAAARALEAEPSSIAAALLLAESRFALDAPEDAASALGVAAESWDDPAMRAALDVRRGRVAEAAGDLTRARDAYRRASEDDPSALDGWFGLARTSAAAGAPTDAIDALATLASRMVGSASEAFATRASRMCGVSVKDPARALALLNGVEGLLPLRARADAARAAGDRAAELEALEAWSAIAGGTERAIALVRMAEASAETGDLDAAEAALRDASLADGTLGTIRVVREVIIRRSGDLSRLTATVETGGALAAAAKVASDPTSLERERELLAQALDETQSLLSADVLLLDVLAGIGDGEALTEALRRHAERTTPEARTGALLARLDHAVRMGDAGSARSALDEARALEPGSPLVLRPLGRLAALSDPDPQACADTWSEEARAASGGRAAFAFTSAARALERCGGDALGAYREALAASTGYLPAVLRLIPLADEVGDALSLQEAYAQRAEVARDGVDRALYLVRGALARAEADPEGAGALLEKAREHAPEDAVLQSLVMRISTDAGAERRGEMLAASAARTTPRLTRVFRLQAAAAFEDAGALARAASEYRAVAEAHPDDPFVAFALDDLEVEAGEVARVAERRFAAVKAAETDDEKVLALERLAELDLHARKDPASAMLSLSSILELAPGHIPSLRWLMRYFAEQGRTEDLRGVVEALVAHLPSPKDVAAHLRLLCRLAVGGEEATGADGDDALIRYAERAELDLWLSRRVLAAARANEKRAVASLAAEALAASLTQAPERASAAVEAAELSDDDDLTRARLTDAVAADPAHPVAAEQLAGRCLAEQLWLEGAEALEKAARASEVRERAAGFWYRAGRLWQERMQDQARARAALEAAAELAITHEDVYERLGALLREEGDLEALGNLVTLRIAAGGDPPELVELYAEQARLATERDDLSTAKAALRASLALSPEHLDALRGLADLCIRDEDWRGAAEVLIRIARVRKDREELRWVFFTLGDIYDVHMPDPRRAEAAFKRVLKLLPQDVEAMERLAGLYEREGQWQNAAETLEELARVDVDPEQNRAHRLRLAGIFERGGDNRRAEQVLEAARRNAPIDIAVLRAMAELYQRQSAQNALAMHLNRAVHDFRHALEADLGDAAAWPGLVEVLGWRGRPEAARAAASAAVALGVGDADVQSLLDARGGAPAGAAGAASEQLDDLLAPPALTLALRNVFRVVGASLEKALPFDVRAYRAEKVGGRDTRVRPIALEVARWLGLPEPEIWVTPAAPRVCVPVSSQPPSLLIGAELLDLTDDREKVFILMRALKIAQAQMAITLRAQPEDLATLLAGLVRIFDPSHAPRGVDPAHVAEASKRVAKALPRRAKDDLGPLVFEMSGRPGYDPTTLPMAASEWGDRVALLAVGSAPAAFSALAKLSGEAAWPPDAGARLAMIQRTAEMSALLSFAISDAHFDARDRTGAGKS